MNVLNYRISLDMFDAVSQTTIKAKKGDSACKINITLTENGKIYHISEGSYATFNAKKSDGNFIYDKCTIENNTIVYDFSSSIDENSIAQISAREGIVECEVTLYNDKNEQLTSPRFTLYIDGTVYNGEEIVSTPESDVLKKLVSDVDKTIAEIEKKAVKVNTDYSNNTFAPIIRQAVSGNIIAINDVSSIEHELKVKAVKLKNHFDLSNIKGLSTANIFIDFRDNTLNIESDGNIMHILGKLTDICPNVNGGDTVTISYSADKTNNILGLKYSNDNDYSTKVIVSTNPNVQKTAKLPDDISDVYVYFHHENNVLSHTLSNITLTNGELLPVTVKRYGKNILDVKTANFYSNNRTDVNNANTGIAYRYEKKDSGFIATTYEEAVSTSANCGYYLGTVEELKGKTITVSADCITTVKGANVNGLINIQATNTIGGSTHNATEVKTLVIRNSNTGEVTAAIGDEYFDKNTGIPLPYIKISFHLWYGGNRADIKNGDTTEYSNIQVEINNTATEYEAYIEPQTATANADGTVNGLTSISPNMTLMADNGAILECEYNADTKLYIDNKFAELSKAILNS